MSDPPSFSDLVRVFGRIGVASFGGPAAQIALMHRELVDERPWLTEQQFLNALSFCMLLPGPEAMQLATYAGWKLHGVRGGLAAGLLFVVPGAIVIFVLAALYAYFGSVPVVEAMFLGVKAAVLVIVIDALRKVAVRALQSPGHWIVAGLSFAGIFLLNMPFPLIIAAAALWGFWKTTGTQDASEQSAEWQKINWPSLGWTTLFWGLAWFAPIAVLWASGAPFLTQIAQFFATLAVVTFGGAYAVLAYMTQEVVTGFGWLTTPQMMDALGLAETTPGPLILVTQFVGFLAGFKEGGLGLALVAGLVTLWVTFVPCFLWIFAGAPFVDRLDRQPKLKGALAGVTASVVGVILNLSIWFGVHVLFTQVGTRSAGPVTLIWPDFATLNLAAFALTVLAALLLFWAKAPLIRVLIALAVAGFGSEVLGLT